MRKFKKLTALLALCVALIGCAPPSVPRGASTSYDWYNGHFTYVWRRTFHSGCAVWMATKDWADVQLIINSRCEGRREDGYLEGRGVGYFSSSDFLEFHGYWPWTEEEYFAQIHYDGHGMTDKIDPCPHALSPEDLDTLRTAAQEALAQATTDAERRMMTRVGERLAATSGTALQSGQGGCTDMPPDWYHGPGPPRVDLWRSR